MMKILNRNPEILVPTWMVLQGISWHGPVVSGMSTA
jgi:hypothetical protein